MTILVITTGGTIGAMPYKDPTNPPQYSCMPMAGEDLVRDSLQTAFAALATRCVSLEPRDSKHIDEAYRQNILEVIEQAPEKTVLITHGTDTLLNTADYFYHRHMKRTALVGKHIMLTGAMTPLSNGENSDGHQNLAFALDQLTRFTPILASTSVILSDFDGQGAWKPRLYPYKPNHYEKFYNSDGRYHRIRTLSAA